MHRKRMVVSGRVQGVGFRFYTCRVAANYPVVGYVRNLPDGDVEVVAEGEAGMVDAFLSAVREGASFSLISSARTYTEPAEGKYTSFGVKY